MKALVLSLLLVGMTLVLPSMASAKVITLFEDDEKFVDSLPNQDSPTTLTVEKKDVFIGKAALKLTTDQAGVTNAQKYNANIPGWTYSIVEKPSQDTDARWVLFAWKQTKGKGIMVQFPDAGAWGDVAAAFVDPPAPRTRRYIAGENLTGWTGIQVSKTAPTEWTPVLRDLWADFTNFSLTGIALTQFNETGYYDSIYLAWTKDELQKIVDSVRAVEPQGKLATQWAALKK